MRTTEEKDQQTSLGSSQEHLDIIPVEVRTRELLEDEVPEVFEQGRIDDIGAVSALVRSTCDQADELANRRDNETARIATLGEGPNLYTVQGPGRAGSGPFSLALTLTLRAGPPSAWPWPCRVGPGPGQGRS